MSSHLLDVAKDLENALENEDNYDIIIIVGEGSDVKELWAHSFVLRAIRCPYFKRALSSNWQKKNNDGNYVFEKPNITSEVFQLILK